MIKSEKKTIGDREYTFLPMTATPARDFLNQLVNKVGPSVADGIQELKGAEDFDLDANIGEALYAMSGSIAGLVRGLSTSLTPSFYAQLVDAFLSRTTIAIFEEETGQTRNQKLDKAFRDQFFATSLFEEAQVLGFCLETQYADFSQLLQKGAMYTTMLKAKKKALSNSDSQKESTGLYTE